MAQRQDRRASVGHILAALSQALDLVEGQPRGHAARSGLIAVKIVQALGLDDTAARDAFYASLLKDSGCSNNSARILKIFGGDDTLVKRRVKICDWANPVQSAKFAYQNLAPGGSPVQKLREMVSNLCGPEDLMAGLTRARCTRGAAIARQLGFSHRVADAIQCLDEHWDGKGAPQKLSGYEIPLLARVVGAAQTIEVFASTYGVESAYEMLQKRKGRWFQPEIVSAATSFQDSERFWDHHRQLLSNPSTYLPQVECEPDATEVDVDQICTAFASIVDAKSTFTGEHSTRVCEYSVMLGRYFEFEESRLEVLRRASLLHDVGKLGVSNSILDKPDKLTDEEFSAVKRHPQFSEEILGSIPGFERIAQIAGAHHEKLNGRGYWRGLEAKHLDLDMRIVAVADVYDALSAERPYREALEPKVVFEILGKEAREALDPDCVAAIEELTRHSLPLAA